MTASQRRKGRDGQTIATHLLTARDWQVDQLTSGISCGDLIATDPGGGEWYVEVKNCASILPAHRKQAMEQAAKRRRRWMLCSKISGTSAWLVQRQGIEPVVWLEAT